MARPGLVHAQAGCIARVTGIAAEMRYVWKTEKHAGYEGVPWHVSRRSRAWHANPVLIDGGLSQSPETG
ncbi:hypothetical protein BN2476_250015 [Paraburkholderia piptadeniae]|uniref:Uncharacterized protein n=1 Tax=Paraburkholderia piptadeniae TaxID=1701573 RepID=A0A1N7S021_9BURK|nr:hypothetical protein BN2476_250015 [Paraburkholderia piptadeniae]